MKPSFPLIYCPTCHRYKHKGSCWGREKQEIKIAGHKKPFKIASHPVKEISNPVLNGVVMVFCGICNQAHAPGRCMGSIKITGVTPE